MLYNGGSFRTPVFFGAVLSVLALVLVYSQVEETLTTDGRTSGAP